MLLLYSIGVGLLLGKVAGGRAAALSGVHFRWWGVALVGLAFQVVLFSTPVGDQVGPWGPALYVGSTIAVLAALLRNVRLPGFSLIAFGAACNLLAIVSNGGRMPASPAAFEALNGRAVVPTDSFSNSVLAGPGTQFPFLGDILVLPRPFPFANVFSVGDLVIGIGAALFVVVAMRSPRPRAVRSDQATAALENARLLAERNQQVAQLAALLDISQSASEASSEREVAAILARKVKVGASADACVISRSEDGSTILQRLGSAGAGEIGAAHGVLGRPAARSVLGDARPVLMRADAADLEWTEASVMRSLRARTLLLLPLMAAGRPIGLVEVAYRSADPEFSEHEMNFYLTMANHAGAVLENARLVDQLRRAADADQVTGVGNHRYLQDRLKQELARCARSHLPLAVLMIDLDGFKAVNDGHGHANGDTVLRGLAQGIKAAVRENDIVARYGGDEFVVLMPDTSVDNGRIVAQRIVRGIREHRHELSDGATVRLSASAGLSAYPEHGRTPGTLLHAADAAMYSVKRDGGGNVRRASRIPEPADVPESAVSGARR